MREGGRRRRRGRGGGVGRREMSGEEVGIVKILRVVTPAQ